MAQLRSNVLRVARRGVGDYIQTPFAVPSNSVKDANGNWIVQNPWAGPPVMVNKASLVSATLNRKGRGTRAARMGPGARRGVGDYIQTPFAVPSNSVKDANGNWIVQNPWAGPPVLVNKASLVKKTLGRIVRKQLGLGDDSSGDITSDNSYDPTYADSNPAGSVPSGSVSVVDTNPSAGMIPGYDASTGLYFPGQAPAGTSPSDIEATPGSSSPMSTIAGGYKPAATTSTNPLSQLLNSVIGNSTAPKYGASGLSYNLGQGLNTPIYSGSSMTNGGLLLMGGVLVGGVLLMKKK